MNNRLDKIRNCMEKGLHLLSCDTDGFCNCCGEQESLEKVIFERTPTSVANPKDEGVYFVLCQFQGSPDIAYFDQHDKMWRRLFSDDFVDVEYWYNPIN